MITFRATVQHPFIHISTTVCIHAQADSEDDYELKMVILLTVILIFLCISGTLLFFICSFSILEKTFKLKQQCLFFSH